MTPEVCARRTIGHSKMRMKKGRLAAGQNSEPTNDWAKMTRGQAGQEPAEDLQVILERILSLANTIATHLEPKK
jgi:hypothetical protein